MNYKLHIASKMFLKDPYIVRIVHPESTMVNLDLSKFRQLLKTAKSIIGDSWGYSNPEFEVIKTVESTVVTSAGVSSFSFSVPEYECHSYWVFTNEMDALQFRLTAGDNAKQMHIWPKKIKFTITEYYNDNNTSP